MNLSGDEKNELRALIDRGEPLPERYRWILFQEPRETELIWPGKTHEVTSVVLPFQSIEQIDEPRTEATGHIGGLFDLDLNTGRQAGGWANKLVWGDNKLILSALKNGPVRREIEEVGGIKLVYIDPPFDVGADFSFQVEIGDEALTKEPSVLESIAYNDTWGRGTDSYVAMMYERLVLIWDLLAPGGNVIVHVGPSVSHLVRALCDEIFNVTSFRNEIVWQRHDPHNDAKKRLGVITDRLLWYGKGENNYYDCEIERTDLSLTGEAEFSLLELPTGEVVSYAGNETVAGRRFKLDDATWKGNSKRFTWRGARPSAKREWMYDHEGMEAALARGELYLRNPEEGAARCKKKYLDENRGVYLQDIWDGVGRMKGGSEYPTQKPDRLLERILRIASPPDSLVADFFCGSGTTLTVAERLGRKWIGCDLGRFAIHTTRKRLIGVQRELKAAQKAYRSFEILNLGKYERQYFAGIDPTLPEAERRTLSLQKEEHYLTLILAAYKAERVFQTPPFHGKKAGALVFVGPIDAPVTEADVALAVATARQLRVSKIDILGFEFEMGLNPKARDDARKQGVEPAFRYIPKDVFDRRACDKGQVVFYDLAYVEVKTHVHELEASVELKSFGVFYRQEADPELKNGSSKVVVEGGQVVKVSKDKGGVVKREVLTKNWSDWIDYWAVDFDFGSRPETIRTLETGADGQKVERSVRTGGFLFENEWQSFRTRNDRKLELTSAPHKYPAKGKYKIAVKVIDIFGNDTTKIVEVIA